MIYMANINETGKAREELLGRALNKLLQDQYYSRKERKELSARIAKDLGSPNVEKRTEAVDVLLGAIFEIRDQTNSTHMKLKGIEKSQKNSK